MTTIENFDVINDATGFANGEQFSSEQQVREYFTVENMIDMFGECEYTQAQLSEMADEVIENKWHFEK